VQAGMPDIAVWAGAFAAGFLCDNILLVNNYRDRENDAAAGKRTLVVRWGEGFARAQYAAAVWTACAALPLALAWSWGAWSLLLPLLLLPRGHILARCLSDTRDKRALNALLADTAKFLFQWTLLLGAGLLVR